MSNQGKFIHIHVESLKNENPVLIQENLDKSVKNIELIIERNLENGRFQFVQDTYDAYLSKERYTLKVIGHYVKYHDLLTALSIGEEASWLDLWQQLYRLGFHRLISYGWEHEKADSKAEEITQEVCTIIYRRLEIYAYDCSFDAWSSLILHNYIKRQYKRSKNPLDVPWKTTPYPGSQDADEFKSQNHQEMLVIKDETNILMELSDERTTLFWAIRQLPSESQRKVIVCSYFEGLSDSEIAKELNKSTQAIYNLKHRALRNIKQILDDEPL